MWFPSCLPDVVSESSPSCFTIAFQMFPRCGLPFVSQVSSTWAPQCPVIFQRWPPIISNWFQLVSMWSSNSIQVVSLSFSFEFETVTAVGVQSWVDRECWEYRDFKQQVTRLLCSPLSIQTESTNTWPYRDLLQGVSKNSLLYVSIIISMNLRTIKVTFKNKPPIWELVYDCFTHIISY